MGEMSEMVEWVAMALSANLEEGFPRFTQQSWGQLSEPAKAVARTRARVAIEAMRDPTDAMALAGAKTDGDCISWSLEPGEGMDDFSALPAWQAMIDEALK